MSLTPPLSPLAYGFSHPPQNDSSVNRGMSRRFFKSLRGLRSSAKATPVKAVEWRASGAMQMKAQILQVGSAGLRGVTAGTGLLHEMERRNRIATSSLKLPAKKQYAEYFYHPTQRRNTNVHYGLSSGESKNSVTVDARYTALFEAAARRADKIIASVTAVQYQDDRVAERPLLPRYVMQMPMEKMTLPRVKLTHPIAPAASLTPYPRVSSSASVSPARRDKHVRFLSPSRATFGATASTISKSANR